MQLANQEVDETLGLAHNVLILIGDIMLYVQFPIVRNPAYDILLGQPFDILVESIVQNYWEYVSSHRSIVELEICLYGSTI